MKSWRLIASLLFLSASAFAGETPLGDEHYVTGTVEAVYIRTPTVFLVTVKDPGDGYTAQAWIKGNNLALATLLAQKAAGGQVRLIYRHMQAITDRDNYCWDQPYIRWVCNMGQYVEAL